MLKDAEVEDALEAALAHHEAGRLDLAEAGYRAVLAKRADDLDALNLLGLILQDRGDLSASIEMLSHAVAVEPDFPEALTNLARAQRAARQPQAAADAAKRALTLDPALAEAYMQLGLAAVDLGDYPSAAQAFEQATVLEPQRAEGFHNLGVARLKERNFAAALQALQTANRLDCKRLDTMVSLGTALAGLERLDEAEDWHQRAAAAAPNDPTAHAALAVTLRRRLDAARSAAACRRTLELAPQRVDILLLLGNNLAALGQFEEAQQTFLRALSINPDSAEAKRDLAMIGQDSITVSERDRLLSILADVSASSTERVAAGFCLGAVFDRIGDTEAAFAAFDKANRLTYERLLTDGLVSSPAELTKHVDWLIEVFDAQIFSKTEGWGAESDLPVFIVGMPRSGTSLVEQILASHPAVVGIGERRDIGDLVQKLHGKVVHRSPLQWDAETVRKVASAHISTLRGMGNGAARVIDKLPDNSLLLGYIALLFPRARVIICRRDLRDVALSCYFKQFTDKMDWSFHLPTITARARNIERLLDHWREVLPLRTIDVYYESLVSDPEREIKRMLDFLGLPWNPACLQHYKTERSVMTASYWEVRQSIYTNSVGRWRSYRKHAAPLLAGLVGTSASASRDEWYSATADRDNALKTAASYHRLGNLDAAEPVYRALLQRDPDDSVALHLLGLLLIDRGDLARAATLIRRSLQLKPDVAAAWADLARAQRGSGDAEAAAESARHAVGLDPQLADGHTQLGHALLLSGDFRAAAASFRAAADIDPRSADAHAGLAHAMLKTEDYPAAEDELRAALALKPDQLELVIDLGGCLCQLGRFEEAAASYRHALTLAPNHPRAQFGLAWALIRTGDAAAAAAACREGISGSPHHLNLWLMLGQACASCGLFDEARDAYRHVLLLEPTSIEALSGLTAIGGHSDSPHLHEQLGQLLSDQTRNATERATAGFARGRELDRQGRYDEAFESYTQANEILRQKAAEEGRVFSREGQRAEIDWAVANFSSDTFVKTTGWGSQSDLPVFIVGMPRSGTSLVEQILASHPSVFGSGEQKDILDALHVIGNGEQIPPSSWDPVAVRRETTSLLHRLQERSQNALRVTDKLPDNILFLGQISILFPKARVIICRRDLRDVCLSCYFQHFFEPVLWSLDLGDCAARARAIERLLLHWRTVIPLKMLEVQYEDLVQDLEGQSRRLIEFLGLDWDPACLAFHHTDRTVFTASHWQVRQPLYRSSIGRWRHYKKHIKPLLDGLQGIVPDDTDQPR